MAQQHLIEILLPKARGDGAPVSKGWFAALLAELAGRFGGVTSFIRASGEGLWDDGRGTERDEIAVIEVMAEGFDDAYWSALKQRLERELAQDEIIIRASLVQRL